ncbi:MAG TPA: DUF3369 domain-containing protein [Azospirillum sp.]
MAGGDDEDDLLFAAEDEVDEADGPDAEAALPPWTVLIVDDDPEVHAITRVVLGDTVFEERALRFLSAHTAAEARAILRGRDDIAVALLDVVMETDDAGLQLVRFIREELGNHQIRIILRTGQPGQAPERKVIVAYDINDYKAKSELTAQTLFTATVAALRSYQHISTIEQSRRGLEKIVDAAAALFERRSLTSFVEGVVVQMGSLLHKARGSFLCTVRRLPDGAAGEAEVLAGSGPFEGAAGQPVGAVVPAAVEADIRTALDTRESVFRRDHCVVVFRSHSHAASVLYIHGHGPLSGLDRQLVEIFCSKVAIGFDNVFLYEQLRNAQRATVHALGKLAEFKDEVTGEHVRRIERWATLIARELRRRGDHPGIVDDLFCEQIGMASMLHDVGKVGIPDAILGKPGKLDPDELRLMREHAAIGGRILREAAGLVQGPSYLGLGAEIAEGHHEKWDGTGYPHGLKGEAIPLSGRIVAVADVYDALLHRRPYKEAWDHTVVMDLIRRETGTHFDPRVVEAFLQVLVNEGVLAAG